MHIVRWMKMVERSEWNFMANLVGWKIVPISMRFNRLLFDWRYECMRWEIERVMSTHALLFLASQCVSYGSFLRISGLHSFHPQQRSKLLVFSPSSSSLLKDVQLCLASLRSMHFLKCVLFMLKCSINSIFLLAKETVSAFYQMHR